MKFSQDNEEEHIVRFFGPNSRGRFLDIGAFDGLTYSNTRALFLQGWTGVMVEPDPWNFAKLYEVYQGNPSVLLINAAIGGIAEPARFWPFAYGSTANLRTTQLNSHFNFGNSFYVQTMSAIQLMELCGRPVDFVNIDAEGMDMEIAHSILPILREARGICIEVGDEPNLADELLKLTGYEPSTFIREGGNRLAFKPGLRK